MYLLRKWFRDLFLYPKQVIGIDEKYWESRGRGSASSLSAWQKERADWALKKIERKPTITILDIGSGDGGVLKYLSSHIPSLTGIGIDRDEGARTTLSSLGFEARNVDLTDPKSLATLPLCDYALLFEIIEHVSQAEELVAAARNIAARGVFFSVPNTGFFTHRFRLLFGKFPAQWTERPNEHVRFWTLRDMRWWLRAQGIQQAEIHTYEGVPLLRHVFPSLFAAGMIVWIPHV